MKKAVKFDGQDMNTLGVGCKSKRGKVGVQYMLVLLNAQSLCVPKHWSMCLRKGGKNLKDNKIKTNRTRFFGQIDTG